MSQISLIKIDFMAFHLISFRPSHGQNISFDETDGYRQSTEYKVKRSVGTPLLLL